MKALKNAGSLLVSCTIFLSWVVQCCSDSSPCSGDVISRKRRNSTAVVEIKAQKGNKKKVALRWHGGCVGVCLQNSWLSGSYSRAVTVTDPFNASPSGDAGAALHSRVDHHAEDTLILHSAATHTGSINQIRWTEYHPKYVVHGLLCK